MISYRGSVNKGRAFLNALAIRAGVVACLGLLCPTMGVYAGSPGSFMRDRAVPDSVLDSMRGGFSMGDLEFNFSFASITWVNNVFQAETDLTIANNVITSLKNITAATVLPNTTIGPIGGSSGSEGSSKSGNSVHSSPLTPPAINVQSGSENSALSSVNASLSTLTKTLSTLVQVGSGNSAGSGNSLSNVSPLTTVIQNNANNVVIQHLSQINGIINNSGTLTHTANMVIRMNQSATMGSILSRF